jgi:hypothetical protein
MGRDKTSQWAGIKRPQVEIGISAPVLNLAPIIAPIDARGPQNYRRNEEPGSVAGLRPLSALYAPF